LKFAYIVSLPHSGSTILSYNLSEHPDVVFLGEVGYALKKLHESRKQDEKTRRARAMQLRKSSRAL
jgi:hypothetical protein